MKKALYLLLSFIIFISIGIGCSKNSQVIDTYIYKYSYNSDIKKADINIATLKGPTAMGMVKLMTDSEDGNTSNNYNFTISGTVDEIVAKIAKGELDIAAVPANLSSVLYNNTKGKISVCAINTLGVLYIVQTSMTDNVDTIKTIQDLKGKTILSTGKGTTPEFALNYILSSNGIDPEKDVNLQYKSEVSEIVSSMQLSSQSSSIAILPQPFVATAQSKDENLKIVLDLTKEWDLIQSDKKSSMITGVIIARNEFIENNRDAFNRFLDEYKSSTQYVNNYIKDASALVEKYNIVPSTIAEKAIPLCNITFIEGSEMQQKLSGYLEVLFNQNPASIGEVLPDEVFYYKR